MEPLRIGVAVAAGKHVLTEKPSASNATEASEVRDAAAAAGVTVLEGFHHLHHPVTRRLLELLDSGELGELRRVEVDAVIPPQGLRAEPLDLVAIAVVALMALQEPVQRVDETADGVEAPRHALVGGEQQTVVLASLQGRPGGERHEVLDVARHDRPSFPGHPPEQLVVAKPDEIGSLGHRAAGRSRASSARRGAASRQRLTSRRQRSSSRSATARARPIHSSISSL
jgi:hypothetical protein